MSGLQGRHEMPPDQHHAARLQPRIHFGARETTLGFLGAEQGAGAVNCRIERRPGGLAVAIAPSGRFSLHLKFGSRSPDSTAFAAGQVKRQVRPEDA